MSNPNPINTDFNPNFFSNKATIGMEPPPRVGMGFLPKVAYIARLSALKGMG